MTVSILFNGHAEEVASPEALGEALQRFDRAAEFELWASVPAGPSLCMLRHGEHAWLMYLRQEGDSGFTSLGEAERPSTQAYILSNGQKDEYPLAWCIPLEQCYRAIAYFHANGGEQPPWIRWLES